MNLLTPHRRNIDVNFHFPLMLHRILINWVGSQPVPIFGLALSRNLPLLKNPLLLVVSSSSSLNHFAPMETFLI
ncbi:hypothetical protein BpHYR1_016822 [Brachionus plicatilis]|uniref:Uncharacterized protein n=1 Tax=Brachionus plicatilis TaxID=10195 RepID=A0A3M7RIF2_BRAPC|nr:hypothetical protein BpHYR1_016822 [Brachionus plicatilis]